MVVAQLEERSLPIPEVHGSIQSSAKNYITFVYYHLCIEKTKIKKKWPGMAHFLRSYRA